MSNHYFESIGKNNLIFNGNSINEKYKKQHFESLAEGYPYIATKDLQFDGTIIYDNGVRIPFDTNYKIGKANSVFICSEGGSAGRKIGYLEQDVCFGNKLFCIQPSTDKYLGKYLYYYLLSPFFQSQFRELMSGLIGGVSAKKFSQIQIITNSISSQLKIVDYLDAVFAKIDELKANAEKQLEDAKALFSAALEEAMKPKEGWEGKSMRELCSIDSKLVNPQDEKYSNLLHVGGANIESFSGNLKNLMTSKEERLNSGKFYFDNNVVLYNKIRPYLVKVARPNFSGLCSADMYPLTPKPCITKDFLYHLLLTKDFTDYAISGSARAGMPKVNRQCLFEYTTSIPSVDDQQSIVSHLDSLSSKVTQLQENYKTIIKECDALKQALLREIFE